MSIHNQPQCYGRNKYQSNGEKFQIRCPKCKEMINNSDCFDPIPFIEAITYIRIGKGTEKLQEMLINADRRR